MTSDTARTASALYPRRSFGQRLASKLASITSPEPVKRLLYSIYGARLQSKIAAGPLPRHIGVVLDGNRRYALLNGYADVAAAYRLGSERVNALLSWCDQLEIPVVTLWSMSLDNLKRDGKEVEGLNLILEEELPKLKDSQDRSARPRRIRVSGRVSMLPQCLQATIATVERATEKHGPFQLNIALGYGGREEIVDAVRQTIREEQAAGGSGGEVADRITPEAIGRHLYFSGAPDPDLIIRTSGEVRLSGFLLWGSVYSEFYFCDALWPAFRKIDLLRAIRSYQARKRRFGS
jgi:short-chain Z-isoprenyl diphosphate synthase